MSPDLINNDPFTSIMPPYPECSSLTSVFKLALKSSPISTKLTPQDVQLLTELVDNTGLIVDIVSFIKDKTNFAIHHVPQFILFITLQVKGFDKKRTQYNLLECIKFIAHTVLLSNVVPFSVADQIILNRILDESITLLQTNIQKPNSKGCFYFC